MAAKKSTVRKVAAAKSVAARTMSSGVKAPKPLKKQEKPGKGPEPRGGSRPGR